MVEEYIFGEDFEIKQKNSNLIKSDSFGTGGASIRARNSRVNFIQWKSSLQNVYFLGKEVRSRAGMYSVPRPFVPIVFILGSSIVGSRNCFETGSRQSVNTILIDTVLCLKVRFYSFETMELYL